MAEGGEEEVEVERRAFEGEWSGGFANHPTAAAVTVLLREEGTDGEGAEMADGGVRNGAQGAAGAAPCGGEHAVLTG